MQPTKRLEKLTDKQQRFADYYLQGKTASEAARLAGYSKHTAQFIGSENLTKPKISEYVERKLAEMASERIATAQEVLEYLTTVVRGTADEEAIVVEGQGKGYSAARKIRKQVGVTDRNKAAEILAKRYGLLQDKVKLDIAPIVLAGNDDIPD